APCSVEAPGVEWALDGLAVDVSAAAEMSTEVGTVTVEQVRLAALAAEEHQVLAEELHPLHVLGAELRGVADLEPADRVLGEREALLGGTGGRSLHDDPPLG